MSRRGRRRGRHRVTLCWRRRGRRRERRRVTLRWRHRGRRPVIFWRRRGRRRGRRRVTLRWRHRGRRPVMLCWRHRGRLRERRRLQRRAHQRIGKVSPLPPPHLQPQGKPPSQPQFWPAPPQRHLLPLALLPTRPARRRSDLSTRLMGAGLLLPFRRSAAARSFDVGLQSRRPSSFFRLRLRRRLQQQQLQRRQQQQQQQPWPRQRTREI
jgi:hypothetical protein